MHLARVSCFLSDGTLDFAGGVINVGEAAHHKGNRCADTAFIPVRNLGRRR